MIEFLVVNVLNVKKEKKKTMEAWKINGKGKWQKRKIGKFPLLAGGLQEFLIQKRKSRQSRESMWVVFEEDEVASLARISRILLHSKVDNDGYAATELLSVVIRNCHGMEIVSVSDGSQISNTKQSIATRSKSYTSIRLYDQY